VTDVTSVGRTYPNASRENPVYCKLIDLGYHPFGRVWAGESIPTHDAALNWLIKAMGQQGYRLADEQHPPTQLLVYTWGMRRDDSMAFLGAGKLRWVQLQKHTGIAEKLFDVATTKITGKRKDNYPEYPCLFLGLVRSFTLDSETAPKVTMLWETRFACPATGLAMGDAMPLMIQAAALNFGRETKVPLNINVSDESKGRVDFGELKVMGSEPPKDKPAPADAR
jgi:hypothetical protein